MKKYWKTALWSMALLIITFTATSCGDDEKPFKSKVYTLQSVGGSSVGGTVTFAEAQNSFTTVTINLTGNTADSVRTAHIHEGVSGSGGAIAFRLTDIVDSKSVTLVDKSYADFLNYNGYVNIHTSITSLKIVATANIGSNE